MVTSRSPRGHHPDDIPEGFRLFAERREGQKRFPAEGLRSRGGRRHPPGGPAREFPPPPILFHPPAPPPPGKRRRRAPKAPKPGPPSTGRSRPRGIPP